MFGRNSLKNGRPVTLPKLLDRLKEIHLPRIGIKLSTNVISILVITITVLLLGGGLYNIIEAGLGRLVILLPSPTNPQFYYFGMADQTLNESAYFILFLIMGISGGYISFRSSRHAYRPREARMLLLIGIALIIVATIGTEAILSWKIL